ncbi:MAG: mechanosensitive ion channel family protein [Deltaproteobacteria bacterium]|nr:mechanosensitive ion channel family protein [Deltaproteobacteria bacterium]
MYFQLKSVLRTLLYFGIIFWVLSSGNPFAKPAAKGESPEKSVSTQTARTGKNRTDSPQVEAEKNETRAPKEKALDKAGERVGQQIDKFSRSASLKIGPLLASLGIGGLAVALAAKDSIANFFGTLTILFDKPFQVGQRITIDQYDGTVENVGFRSTRIRTLTGHLVTIPNEKLVNSSVENIGERPHIRWLTNIGITYDTPPEKVEKAVQIIREILENHEGMKEDFPPRVFFNGFNDWSLNIMVVVWYHPPNYWDYQEWLQKVCLEIMRRFEAEDIDFAFPSRTIYLANDDKRRLKLKMLKGEQS